MDKLTVRDLMLPGAKAWNTTLIQQLFPPELATNILKTPLLETSTCDELLWSPTSSGQYSVRSAYHLCQSALRTEAHRDPRSNWKLVWRLVVPPKVRHFIWHMCTHCLPTRVRLRDKGVVCTPLCAVCSKEFETAWHSLIVFPRSQKCWEKVGLWPAIHQAIYHVQDPKDLFFRIAGCLDKDKLSQAALIMWNIWISRNSKEWEDTNETHQ